MVAVAPGGEVVGACLNGCHEPSHVGQMEAEAESCPNPKLKKILRFLATLERRADVFGKFPEVDKLLEIRTIAVDGAWRGRGVATALMERTRSVPASNCLLHCAKETSKSEPEVM